MNEPDPAKSRFFALNLTRLMGVAFVIFGMLVATGRVLADLPDWVGYLLIANGLVDVFVLPAFLARRWRSPK